MITIRVLKKYKITSISGNSQYAGQGPDRGDQMANSILQNAGFVDSYGRPDGAHLYIGGEPAKDKEFFVYYREPTEADDKGSFRLVRVEADGKETIIDRGTATESHTDSTGPDTGVFTFYGKGSELISWSFHCNPKHVSEETVKVMPKIFIIQTSSGKDVVSEALTALGLKEDEHYRFVSFSDNLEQLVEGHEPKLVIMGSNHGQVDFIPDLVRKLKKANPVLTCFGFSSYILPGVDRSVTWEGGSNAATENLRSIIEPFVSLLIG